MKFDIVLFDLDGTISRSGLGITRCVQYALSSIGIEETDQEKLQTFIGPPLNEQFQRVYGVDEKTAVQLVEKYRERYNTKGIYEAEMYEGIEAVLKTVTSYGKAIIVSSKPQIYLGTILEHFGIKDYFSAICGPTLSKKETSSKASMIASVKEKYPHASICMVGDRKFDIEGAKANGVFSVAVSYGYGTMEEILAAGPDHIVDSPQDLQAFFGN